MTQRPLPQQLIPVDERQAKLTIHHLFEWKDAITAFLLAVRLDVDRELAPTLPPAAGRAYPYGRCAEITTAVMTKLRSAVDGAAAEPDPGAVAIRDFIRDGGLVRHVWGALRGAYFQNAFQFGALYVDVANDTVVVTKPKIEILPLTKSGMENIRDLEHFAAIARVYWGGDVWANTVAPSLAPILPMVTASPGRIAPGLHPASDQMIAMMCRDRFRQAEAWILNAPAPPAEVARALLATSPPDLHPVTDDPREEAAAACRAAAAAAHSENGHWRHQRVRDYARLIRNTPRADPPS